MQTKINFGKITKKTQQIALGIRKALWFMGEHAFAIVLVLIFLDIVFGGFLVYKYSILAETQKAKIDISSFQFKEGAYQAILGQWEKRDKNLGDSLKKNYPSPF